MKLWDLSCLLLSVPLACSATKPAPETPNKEPQPAARPADDSSHKAGPVGTKLVQDATDSPEQYVIGSAESGGLGGMTISLDGKPIWPPTGDGCDKLVACCSALAGIAKPLALSCLLATARDKKCDAALATAVAVATEQSYPLPSSCPKP